MVPGTRCVSNSGTPVLRRSRGSGQVLRRRCARRGPIGPGGGGGHRTLEVLGAAPVALYRPAARRPWCHASGGPKCRPTSPRRCSRTRSWLSASDWPRTASTPEPGPSPGTWPRGVRPPRSVDDPPGAATPRLRHPPAPEAPRSSWKRFESSLPNETWQSDMTHWHLDDEDPSRSSTSSTTTRAPCWPAWPCRWLRHPKWCGSSLKQRPFTAFPPQCSQTTAPSTPPPIGAATAAWRSSWPPSGSPSNTASPTIPRLRARSSATTSP